MHRGIEAWQRRKDFVVSTHLCINASILLKSEISLCLEKTKIYTLSELAVPECPELRKF